MHGETLKKEWFYCLSHHWDVKNCITVGPTPPFQTQKWHTYTVSNFSLEQYDNKVEAFMLHLKTYDETWVQVLSLNRNGS